MYYKGCVTNFASSPKLPNIQTREDSDLEHGSALQNSRSAAELWNFARHKIISNRQMDQLYIRDVIISQSLERKEGHSFCSQSTLKNNSPYFVSLTLSFPHHPGCRAKMCKELKQCKCKTEIHCNRLDHLAAGHLENTVQ